MHLFGAGVANHFDDLTARGAAYDRVVDDHDAFALKKALDRVQLQADAEMSNRLGRFDECAADIVASDQAEFEGEPSGFGVPQRRRDAAVRHGDDEVGIDRLVLEEGAPHALSGVVDADSVERGIRSREVHILEDAHVPALRVGAKRAKAMQPGLVDEDHLAGIDVADELGADQLKRWRFRGDDVRAIELAQAQGAKSVRVTHGYQLVGRKEDERIGTLDLMQGVRHTVGRGLGFGACDQMNEHLGVAIGREDRAIPFELMSKRKTVGQISVVGDCDGTMPAVNGVIGVSSGQIITLHVRMTYC